jgi:hypothetical protein
MIKKIEEQVELIDLTGLTDDEIHYIGECFAKELRKLIDAYKPYFMKHNFFIKLCDIYNIVKAELKREERAVE